MRTLLATAMFMTLPALAQTGFPGINPAMMLSPGMANPLGMMAPVPFNPFGMGTPPGMGTPMLGGLLYPGMQMAPNLLSHQYLQYMTNPYLGGPAAGNPYLRPPLPNPFAPPGFGPGLPLVGGYGQPAMAWPSPYSVRSQGSMMQPFQSPVPGRLLAPSPASTPAQVMPLPFDPTSWFGQFARPPGK
ncbi:MAG: hypothetical protein ACUVT2_05285 [Thiobacillaceae bacterium]